MAWHAQLRLDYSQEGGRTVARFAHDGPLRILQSLWPEGDAICHNVLVHPPGGLVGGDTLQIDVSGAAGSCSVDAPGAAGTYSLCAEGGCSANAGAASMREQITAASVFFMTPRRSNTTRRAPSVVSQERRAASSTTSRAR